MQNQDGIVTPDNVTTIRHVDANRAVEWITSGFNLFMKRPGELIIAGLVLFAINLVLAFVPVIGGGLATMAGVVAAGVMMRACQAIEQGQDPIAAGKQVAGNTSLLVVGLIAVGFGIAIALLAGLMVAMVVGVAFISTAAAAGLGVVAWMVTMLLSIPLLMALWLAPGLVVMKNTQPVEAIRLSFLASLKNLLAFFVFYIIAAIMSALGAMLMGLGLIVVFPVLLCAGYMAYKDIFGSAASGEAVGYIQDAQ